MMEELEDKEITATTCAEESLMRQVAHGAQLRRRALIPAGCDLQRRQIAGRVGVCGVRVVGTARREGRLPRGLKLRKRDAVQYLEHAVQLDGKRRHRGGGHGRSPRNRTEVSHPFLPLIIRL